jgi:diguanylate cyclase (GGDEF)-like protein
VPSFRRIATAGLSLALVVALGALALMTSSAANHKASSVHRVDRIQATEILSGLAGQYLKFTALELSQLANSDEWSLRAGSAGDGRRLRQFTASSPLFKYGAAVVSLSARPLSVAETPPGLPKRTDPGYLPMIAGLRARTFGLSSVMRVGRTPVVAMAVPIAIAGTPRAVLIGYADARRWPLEGYLLQQVRFGPTAMPLIVDGNGVTVAAGTRSLVGKPIPRPLRAVVGKRKGFIRYRFGGKSYVASYTGTGVGGWTHIDVQSAGAFSGSLDRHAAEVGVAVIALLAAAVAMLLLLAFKRNQALRQLADEALYDPLTGLQSRRLFTIRLDAAIARQRRTGASFGVIFCDLDGFKPVNDRYGHSTGDAVLCEVAQRLRSSVRAGDSVGRPGGDEFVLLLEDLDDAAQLTSMAESIKQSVIAPLEVKEKTLAVGMSLGGVLHRPAAWSSAEEIMHIADLAMYQSRANDEIQIAVLGEALSSDFASR